MTISKARLDSVFSDLFGKSVNDIISYLIQTDPDEMNEEKILSFVRPRVKTSPEKILGSIHGYEFLGVQRDKLESLNELGADMSV